MRKAAVLILVFGLAIAAAPLSAQISSLTPESPKWDQVVSVTYDPSAKGAKFPTGDDVYIRYAFMSGGAVKGNSLRLARAGDKLTAALRVPAGAGFLTIYFMTLDSWDPEATLGVRVFRPDGKPACDAWHGQMAHDFSPETYLKAFDEERREYPENLTVFRDKWFFESSFNKGAWKDIVARELGSIDAPGAAETLERLYVVSYGRLLLGDEPAGRAALRRMLELDPDHPLTAAALGSYEYQVFAQQIKGGGPDEVAGLKTSLLLKRPSCPALRDTLDAYAYDDAIPLESLRAGCRAWLADEPANPLPRLIWATALLKKGGDLNEGDSLMAEGLDGLITGRLRLHGDISGSLTRLWLPRFYVLAAELHEKLGRLALAMAEAKAARSVENESRVDAVEREASIWRAAGATRRAELAYLEARRLGSKSAEARLKSLFRVRHGSEDGFGAWLARESGAEAPAAIGAKKSAPDFEVKDINGASVRLSDLIGKVVVLNFWFVGCAPCRVEMPGLNSLVKEFAGQDVVFLGLALDKASDLKRFLAEHVFLYRIIPEAAEIARKFGVSSYPTHILINPKGEIELFSTGGSEKRHEDLRPLIKTLLGPAH